MRFFSDWPFFFLWFGAAVSLSEILAGTLLAPLGLISGLAAIVLGHVIGTTLLVLGGVIGTRRNQTAMGSTQAAFGSLGKQLFALINIIQLVGWTAVMLKVGAEQFDHLGELLWHTDVPAVWTVLLGVLVLAWIGFGRAGVGLLNTTAVALLIMLTVVVFWQLFAHPATAAGGGQLPAMRFGAGLELVVVMPLSWLPLIADYNRRGRTVAGSAVSSWVGYMLGSSWMYAIGLLMALAMGGMDLSALASGTAAIVAMLVVVVLSTTTTTFLDAYSAGVSFLNILPRWHARPVALAMGLIGLAIALFSPLSAYQSFLYTIGALFAPLYAVVLSRHFILRMQDDEQRMLAWPALVTWAIGVAGYYGFLTLDTPVGATLPAIVVTALIYVAVQQCLPRPAPGRAAVRQG